MDTYLHRNSLRSLLVYNIVKHTRNINCEEELDNRLISTIFTCATFIPKWFYLTDITEHSIEIAKRTFRDYCFSIRGYVPKDKISIEAMVLHIYRDLFETDMKLPDMYHYINVKFEPLLDEFPYRIIGYDSYEYDKYYSRLTIYCEHSSSHSDSSVFFIENEYNTLLKNNFVRINMLNIIDINHC